jgi:hypothetical protein
MRMGRSAALVAVTALALSGCATHSEAPVSRTVTFSEVSGGDSDGYWQPTSAIGTTDEFGNTLKFDVTISNDNETYVFAVATITYADGSTMVYQDDDPRHYFALVKTTTYGELPCPDQFPDDVDGASIKITEG